VTDRAERVLITGGGGFVARWLSADLRGSGARVLLAGLGERPDFADAHGAEWRALDIRRPDMVRDVVTEFLPTAVYHLAGAASPPETENAAVDTYGVHVLGVVALLDVLRRLRDAGQGDPTVLVVGSATQYGIHPWADQPLDEAAALRPNGVYAGSKAAQEVAALQAHRAHGLRVICTRSFNHSGVGHGQGYVLPSLVRRALELRSTGGRTLAIGEDSLRDYLHVTDVVSAYRALIARGAPGEVYNVSSGVGVRVSALARDVLLRVGVEADISTTPILARRNDMSELVGSPAKLKAATGWAPLRTHLDIIDDLIHAASQ
jgi:GDP-4-dehydro-6-deoxy-D-mannose reductase